MIGSPSCGIASNRQDVPSFCPRPNGTVGCRIVGGEPAAPGRQPWQVGVQKFMEQNFMTFCGNDNAKFCSQTLITLKICLLLTLVKQLKCLSTRDHYLKPFLWLPMNKINNLFIF